MDLEPWSLISLWTLSLEDRALLENLESLEAYPPCLESLENLERYVTACTPVHSLPTQSSFRHKQKQKQHIHNTFQNGSLRFLFFSFFLHELF